MRRGLQIAAPWWASRFIIDQYQRSVFNTYTCPEDVRYGEREYGRSQTSNGFVVAETER